MQAAEAIESDAVRYGFRLYAARRFGEAERVVFRLIRERAARSEVQYLAGLVAHAQNRSTEAAERFRRALALDPTNAGALNGLGAVLRRFASPGAAEAAFRRALVVHRNDARAYGNLSTLMIERKRMAAAAAMCRCALALQPGWSDLWSRLGRATAALRQYPTADAALRRAVMTASNPGDALALLTQLRFLPGRRAAAAIALRHSLVLEPAGVGVLCGLAAVDRERGDLLSMASHYRRAARLDPAQATCIALAGVRMAAGA